MNDLNVNVFLSAIQAAFNSAVKAAVDQATAPLVERIEGLSAQLLTQHEGMTAMRDRITTLENNPAQGVDTTQVRDALTQLDSQEWFWSKISDFIDREFDVRGIVSETRVEELVQEAMDDHTSTYDHDDYDSHISDDDKHFDGDIEDAVRDALSNMTFDVSIR